LLANPYESRTRMMESAGKKQKILFLRQSPWKGPRKKMSEGGTSRSLREKGISVIQTKKKNKNQQNSEKKQPTGGVKEERKGADQWNQASIKM